MSDPTERFSSRVEDYARYRPGYPIEVMTVLREDCGLTTEATVADVAAGTGLFTRLLLENGNRVFAVEPNDAMRRAGAELLAGFAKLTMVKGMAEATTLADGSVDMVTAAQAAHWFRRDEARREFARILKPGGWCVLVWNERCTGSTPFLRAYEDLLLAFGTDYQEVRHERTTAAIGQFFAPGEYCEKVFEIRQQFDYEGAEGRLLSSSYTPPAGHPRRKPMLKELKRIFREHQREGSVVFEYKTRVYYGRV